MTIRTRLRITLIGAALWNKREHRNLIVDQLQELNLVVASVQGEMIYTHWEIISDGASADQFATDILDLADALENVCNGMIQVEFNRSRECDVRAS